jgi:hypothetical protein
MLFLLVSVLGVSACSPSPVTTGSKTVQTTFESAGSAATTQATSAASATSTEGQTTAPILSDEMTPDDLSVDIDGQIYTMLGEAASLIAGLGEPIFFSEAQSCLYEGTDKTYEYTDLSLYTITQNSKELVDGIDLITGRWQTRRGIKVGSTHEDVLAAYGDPFSEDIDLVYITNESLGETSPRITFVMTDGLVNMISIYSGSNTAVE